MYDSEKKETDMDKQRDRRTEKQNRLGSDKLGGYKRDISESRDEVLVQEDDEKGGESNKDVK